MRDAARLTDQLRQFYAAHRAAHDGPADPVGIRGRIRYVLLDGAGRPVLEGTVPNLVTETGDRYYGERAAGVAGAPAAVTGMQLGTATTTPAKTGGGAAIGTLVASSLVALSGTPTSGLAGGARRITYQASWAAGVATQASPQIAEVALVNQSTGTQTAAPAAATIARALLSPTVPKAADDTLAIVWTHDLAGA